MSNMKCPFCGEKLESSFGYGIELCSCSKCGCKGFDLMGTCDMWQRLIRTHKALDVAVDGLEKMTWGCNSSDAEHLLKEIKAITALEQKDK